MSMETEARVCNKCGRKLILQDISDAHGGGGIEFLAAPLKGDDVRKWVAVDRCPGCDNELSRETTHKVDE